MTNFVQNPGKRNYVAGADIASGEVIGPVGTGSLFFVAATDIANGQEGAVYDEGHFQLDATAADAWGDGDVLYWDPATDKLTDVAGLLKKIGVAVGAKAAAATSAVVNLNKHAAPV